jgi:hypothetical protein
MERWQLIENLISGNLIKKRGAEIGCWKGRTSHYLLKQFPQLTLICVDPYKNYPHWDKYHATGMYKDPVEFNALGESLFGDLKRKHGNRVWCIRKESLVAPPKVEDESLDFVFVDANYGYEYVKEDNIAWLPKLRIGGIMIGQIIDSSKDSPESVKRGVEETIGTDYQVKERRWYYVKKESDKEKFKKNRPEVRKEDG